MKKHKILKSSLISVSAFVCSANVLHADQIKYWNKKQSKEEWVQYHKEPDFGRTYRHDPLIAEKYFHFHKASVVTSSDGVTIFKVIGRTRYVANPGFVSMFPGGPPPDQQTKAYISRNKGREKWGDDYYIDGIDCKRKETVIAKPAKIFFYRKRLPIEMNPKSINFSSHNYAKFKTICQGNKYPISNKTFDQLKEKPGLRNIYLTCKENEGDIDHYIYIKRSNKKALGYYNTDPLSLNKEFYDEGGIISSSLYYNGWNERAKKEYELKKKMFWLKEEANRFKFAVKNKPTFAELRKIGRRDWTEYVWEIDLDLVNNTLNSVYSKSYVDLDTNNVKSTVLRNRTSKVSCRKLTPNSPEFAKIIYRTDYILDNGIRPKEVEETNANRSNLNTKVKPNSEGNSQSLCKNAADYDGCMRYQGSK